MIKSSLLILYLLLFVPAQVNAGLFDVVCRGLQTCRMYKMVHRKELVEITDDLLISECVHIDVKRAISEKGRRVFLFEYPSDGMQIKGYISFVPEAHNHRLLVFLRGGASIYEVKSPGDRINFCGNDTIISTTYRSGPSPGRDEFGGRDVVDVKHLIDHIPVLEEKLGITLSANEKVAIGFSRGGMQLFLAFHRFPELSVYFDRAVSVCGVLDLEHFLQNNRSFAFLIRFFLMQRVDQNWVDVRNPLNICHCFPKQIPLLIIQGDQDRIVDLSAGRKMTQRLREQHCKVDYHEEKGATHCHYSLMDVVYKWLGPVTK